MTLTQHATSSFASYGLFVLETIAALAVIALAGWAVVRFGGPRFSLNRKNRRLKLIERLVLEPRRSIHLVEIDGETLLIGTSDRSVSLIKKLDTSETGPAEEPAPPPSDPGFGE
jgi:flagellar biosynthetic protein FliO